MKLNLFRFGMLSLFTLSLGSVAQASHFGIDGRNGSDGFSGPSGRSGQDITITADGTQRFFDLSGTDGAPGGWASDADSAWGCSQPYGVPHDVWGASGGNGGDGGRGGNGGSGGDVTVYYNDVSFLRSITVRSTPGQASYGGNAGRGGAGCRCTYFSWTTERCQDIRRPDGSFERRCETDTHYCRDGRDGYNGSQGSHGSQGSYGQVTLIPQLEPLIPNVQSQTRNFSQIAETFQLEMNQWSSRQGTLALFGNGSDLSNTYTIFTGRRAFPVKINWAARRAVSEFQSNSVTAQVSSGEVSVSPAQNIWAQISKAMNGTTSVFTVQKIIKAAEATNLSVSVRGNGNTTELVLHDASAVSDLVGTAVSLKLEADTLFDRNLFEGVVPANLLSIQRNQLVIKVGNMGIKEKYLKSGKVLKADFNVSRSLGGRSANWVKSWEGALR